MFMHKLSSENKAVHEKVIDVHKDTINRLFERLNKDNISEKEMGYIYKEISSLSEKIEDARKSWKDWAGKVGFGLLGILATFAGGYASTKLDERNKRSADVIEAGFNELNSSRRDK
ncbi:hypothetical protein AB4X15_03570 [Peribacillus simplex]|uniref:hypothetical protein n=1 Tax=Peribacillus simplex TaxID=1478 RepID=UPI0034E8D260